MQVNAQGYFHLRTSAQEDYLLRYKPDSWHGMLLFCFYLYFLSSHPHYFQVREAQSPE